MSHTLKASASCLSVWIVAGAVLILKALYIFTSSVRGLASTTWLIDDSFIEMCVSRNIARGNGFSMDGLHPTTGAPFFWTYLEAINHFLPTKDLAIRATFLQSSLFGALATVVIFFLALKLTDDRRVAWTAFLLSTFSASLFFNAMNGMDTACFTFFVVLAVALFLDTGRSARWSGFAWGSLTGLAAGLAAATRGDGIFLLFALGCCKFWQCCTAERSKRKEYIHFLTGLVLLSGLCFAVFMSWQIVQTGSPFPGNQVGRRELALALHGFSFDHFVLSQYVKIVIWNVFQLESLLTVVTGGFLLALIAFINGCCRKRLRMLSAISVLYLGSFFALLVAYQWYFPDFHGLRYINPAAHIFFIYVAILLWQLPVEYGKKCSVVVMSLCIIGLAGYRHYQLGTRNDLAPYMSYVSRPDPAMNKQMWGAIDWMKEHLPPGTVVGVRDYGRHCMFTDLPIQDLAGNIDPLAAYALNNGTLEQFLKERNVHYLLIPSLDQRSDKLYQYLHSHLHLELVPDVPPEPTEHLYRIVES